MHPDTERNRAARAFLTDETGLRFEITRGFEDQTGKVAAPV
jgi:hypothetical protein